MPAIFNFIKTRHKKGDASRQVPSASDMNKVATILQDIQGIGCRIEKPTDRGGKGWHVVVDGSTDIDPPDGSVVHQNTKATVVKSSNVANTTTAISATYVTWNATAIETNDTVLESVSGGVLIKEGYSGIYHISVQANGSLTFTSAGNQWSRLTLTRDGVQDSPNIWELVYTTEDAIYATEKIEKTDSGSKSIFVDASSDDVLLSFDYSLDVTSGGSTGIAAVIINAFTVELAELRTSAT